MSKFSKNLQVFLFAVITCVSVLNCFALTITLLPKLKYLIFSPIILCYFFYFNNLKINNVYGTQYCIVCFRPTIHVVSCQNFVIFKINPANNCVGYEEGKVPKSFIGFEFVRNFFLTTKINIL